jgi:hypothetical protein
LPIGVFFLIIIIPPFSALIKNYIKKIRDNYWVLVGYTIVDEFGCACFNTNKFLKHFGGLNKGRPNEETSNMPKPAEKLKNQPQNGS